MKTAILFILTGIFFLTGCTSPKELVNNRRLERAFKLDARRKMDDSLFEKALNKGADPNMIMKNGATPLIMSIAKNRMDRMNRLLKAGADVNKRGKKGNTPLHIAAGLGRMDAVNILLKAGANVNASGSHGRTPLMDAVRIGNCSTAEILLKAGADVNAKDGHDRTALIHAAMAQKNSLKSAKILINKGADFKIYDKDMKLAVMHAAEMKHTDTALYLLDLIPDLPKKPALGMVIMHSAIKGGDIKVTEKLIDNRIPLNRDLSLLLQGSEIIQMEGTYRLFVRTGLLGRSQMPLHWAAKYNQFDIVKLLVARGADPHQRDELSDVPAELTTSNEIAEFLNKQPEKGGKN